MQTNKIIRNTMIGLSAFIGSSNFTPTNQKLASTTKDMIVRTLKLPAKTLQELDSLPLKGLTIMINPGHGEKTILKEAAPGATARLKGKEIYEKDLNDCFSKYEAIELEKLGAKVIKIDNTRVPDILVEKLTQKPDLFISNHCDAQSKRSKKIAQRVFSGETIYTLNTMGKKLAEFINNELRVDLDVPNNGVKANVDYMVLLKKLKDVDSKGRKIVYTNANEELYKEQAEIPSILIEHGYMTCDNNLEKLTSDGYQRKSAKLIVQGIVNYIKSFEPPKFEIPMLWKQRKKNISTDWVKDAKSTN